MEIEGAGILPRLDVFVHRVSDGSLGHQVYRKPTVAPAGCLSLNLLPEGQSEDS